ncbi:hypothetical protein [Paucibacter sp. M5-1]|uniref:hypothetical protein n=1 Tax=Paucibacter sp. M5-1 TaxID=3015998 RepID=UPI0022B91EB1|nr:hypothetical protein [Paucibacter sp. M5-1]MCZ7883790.1 hypothetical protein [Paucibacter sp. M5-1]
MQADAKATTTGRVKRTAVGTATRPTLNAVPSTSAATVEVPTQPDFEHERKAATRRASEAAPDARSAHRFNALNPAYMKGLLSGLMERAAPNLTDEELQSLTTVGDPCALVGQLAAMTEGLGCLIGDDVNVGSFRDQDSVKDLLFLTANIARQAEALMRLSEDAERELTSRFYARRPQ